MSGPAPLVCLTAACDGLRRVGVAVSGGGDSVAALVLAVEALGTDRVAAVTVDHGLRADSAAEAAEVAALCARLGVVHDVLRWAGPEGGNLQDEARKARQRLIAAWAKDRVEAVILAHTADDQAETVLMRLARGSGVDGLAGMAADRVAQGIRWLRPFLGVRRDTLREVLTIRGIGWVEDPSNEDPRFQRVRARRALAALSSMGIEVDGLVATAERMRRARKALEAQTRTAMEVHLREDRGTVLIAGAAFALLPEIRDRLFAQVLMALSGDVHPPRLEALHRWLDARGGTLAGCVLTEAPEGYRLFREAAAVSGHEVGAVETWDGRWSAQGPAEDAVIRALGDRGVTQLSAQAARGLHPHWRETGLPRAALEGLPGLWRGGDLVAAPLAFWPQGWQLRARPLAAITFRESQSH